MKIDKYVICINNKNVNLDITQYDFCIQLVKDQNISSLFELQNKPCFNKYSSMVMSDDKFLTYVKLFSHNIPLQRPYLEILILMV